MTTREEMVHAAVAAMAALISNSADAPDPKEAAQLAVQYAQALVEELEEGEAAIEEQETQEKTMDNTNVAKMYDKDAVKAIVDDVLEAKLNASG